MNTLFIGRNMIKLDAIGSTNSYANEQLKRENLPEGTIIWTNNQTNGRGQRGNTWESEPFKNLAFSLILNPSFLAIDKQFYLNKAISLGVADFVSAIVKGKAEIKIKWPNDIYAGSKKIAGILIENSVRNDRIINSVVGVGININQEHFSESIANATSLKCICAEEFDLIPCLDQLSDSIEKYYLLLKAEKDGLLDGAYQNALYLFGQWHQYKTDIGIITAKIIEISKKGKIVLQTEEDKKSEYGFKEISFMP